jgi:16S rRNA G527 N7-methylase RsmG
MQLTNTTVFYGDILSLPDNDNYDFITARYFSDAGNIFSFANSRLKPDGSMLLFKPDSAAVELESLEWSITDIIDVGNQRSLFKLKHDNSSYSESRTA